MMMIKYCVQLTQHCLKCRTELLCFISFLFVLFPPRSQLSVDWNMFADRNTHRRWRTWRCESRTNQREFQNVLCDHGCSDHSLVAMSTGSCLANRRMLYAFSKRESVTRTTQISRPPWVAGNQPIEAETTSSRPCYWTCQDSVMTDCRLTPLAVGFDCSTAMAPLKDHPPLSAASQC